MTTVVPGPVTADPGSAADRAAAERMLATVYRLAGDEFTGRRVGTPGNRAAATWLTDQLRHLGAAVTVDKFRVTGAVKDLYETPLLRWTNDLGTWRLVHRRDFCEHLASADTPQLRIGRLALPGDPDPGGAWLLDGRFSAERVAQTAAAGARGVLVPGGTDEAGWMPKMIAGPAAGPVPVLAVRTDLHQQMRAITAGGTATVSASVPLRTVDVTGANVLGVVREGGPHQLSVLLTAHFDGVGDDPEMRLPAAADNASGVAVVLEAARQLCGRCRRTRRGSRRRGRWPGPSTVGRPGSGRTPGWGSAARCGNAIGQPPVRRSRHSGDRDRHGTTRLPNPSRNPGPGSSRRRCWPPPASSSPPCTTSPPIPSAHPDYPSDSTRGTSCPSWDYWIGRAQKSTPHGCELVDPTRMQLVEMLARRRERIGCHHGRWRDVLLLERRGRHVAST